MVHGFFFYYNYIYGTVNNQRPNLHAMTVCDLIEDQYFRLTFKAPQFKKTMKEKKSDWVSSHEN